MKKKYRMIFVFLSLLTFYLVISLFDVLPSQENMRQISPAQKDTSHISGAAQVNWMNNNVEYTPIVLEYHHDDSIATKEKIHK